MPIFSPKVSLIEPLIPSFARKTTNFDLNNQMQNKRIGRRTIKIVIKMHYDQSLLQIPQQRGHQTHQQDDLFLTIFGCPRVKVVEMLRLKKRLKWVKFHFHTIISSKSYSFL